MPSGASDKVIPYPAISSTALWRKLSARLAYDVDDVDIIGRSICEVEAAFSKYWSFGLAVNESKTKLLLATAKDTSIGISVEIDCYNFVVVKNFVYLSSSTNTDNISLEIRRMITLMLLFG